MRKTAAAQGFTLLELTVVLVIIGILIGGISVGNSIIHNTKIRKVASDMDKYMTAIRLFRNTYHALPGDMPNASDYWYNAAYCDTGPLPDGCNGNGDGTLTYVNFTRNETSASWQHLRLAKLVLGDPTDISDLTALEHLRGPLEGSSYILDKRVLRFNRYASSQPILIPEDAQWIDRKLDDGFPTTGTLTASKGYNNPTETCRTTDTPPLYQMDMETAGCIILQPLY